MRAQLKGAIVMTAPMMTNFVRRDRPAAERPELRAEFSGLCDERRSWRGAASPVQAEAPQQPAGRGGADTAQAITDSPA